MVRKLIFSLVLACAGAFAYAQNAYDALRFSQQYSEGTARSVAMGNAFVALGGDMGGLSVNPASSAVYRYSELVFTPSITVSNTESDYLGSLASAGKTRAGIANFGFIGSYSTGRRSGLVNWSVGLVLNKQNNYTNARKVYGVTDESSWLASLAYGTDGIFAPDMDLNDRNEPFYYSNASWNSILAWNNSLLDTLPGTRDQYYAATENLNGYDISVGGELAQRFNAVSTGNTTEAVINWGGNFSNKLFIGVNMGIQSIVYKYEEDYSEEALNSRDFMSGFSYFNAGYRYKATGTGINLKAGLIYLPTEWLRLGASISTPTWFYLSEEWENGMNSEFDDGYKQRLISPLGTYNYRLDTPFRWNVGAALRMGNRGVLSADYERVDYTKAQLRDADYEFGYDVENSDIKRLFTTQDIIRIGAEVNVNPAFAVRGGFQHYSSPYSGGSSDDALSIGSLGIGYVWPCGASDFFIDMTYQQKLQKSSEEFSLYDDTNIAAPTGISENSNWKLLVSFGFKF